MLVPLVLNLMLWLAPRISPQPFANEVLANVPGASEQLAPLVAQQRELGIPFDLRLFGLLQLARPLVGQVAAPPSPWSAAPWHVGDTVVLLGTLLAVNLLALAVLTAYFGVVSAAVLPSTAASSTLRHWLRRFWRVGGVVAIWLAIAVGLFLPFAFVGTLLSFVAPIVGTAVGLVGVVLLLWMLWTGQFAFAAVTLNDVSPARALLNSVVVVRHWFWSTLGLWLLNRLIIGGLDVIWRQFALGGVLGWSLAVLGSSYVTAGLLTADFVFYRERIKG